MTKDATLTLTPASCRAARAYLTWSRDDLARRCGVGVGRIQAYERASRFVGLEAIRSLEDCFRAAGVTFRVAPDASITIEVAPATVLAQEHMSEDDKPYSHIDGRRLLVLGLLPRRGSAQ